MLQSQKTFKLAYDRLTKIQASSFIIGENSIIVDNKFHKTNKKAMSPSILTGYVSQNIEHVTKLANDLLGKTIRNIYYNNSNITTVINDLNIDLSMISGHGKVVRKGRHYYSMSIINHIINSTYNQVDELRITTYLSNYGFKFIDVRPIDSKQTEYHDAKFSTNGFEYKSYNLPKIASVDSILGVLLSFFNEK